MKHRGFFWRRPIKLQCRRETHQRRLSAGILKSTCYIDVRWFPFDVQKCDLKFGSWTHNGWLLDLQMMDVDVSTYIPNGEWDLVGERTRKVSSEMLLVESEGLLRGRTLSNIHPDTLLGFWTAACSPLNLGTC